MSPRHCAFHISSPLSRCAHGNANEGKASKREATRRVVRGPVGATKGSTKKPTKGATKGATKEETKLRRAIPLLMPSPARQRSRRSTVSYTHLRAHETPEHLVCRL